jgi:hypothetical protein
MENGLSRQSTPRGARLSDEQNGCDILLADLHRTENAAEVSAEMMLLWLKELNRRQLILDAKLESLSGMLENASRDRATK